MSDTLYDEIDPDHLAREIVRVVGESIPYDMAKDVVDRVMQDSSIHLRAVMVATARKKIRRLLRLIDFAEKLEDEIMSDARMKTATTNQLISTLREINNSNESTIDFVLKILAGDDFKKLEDLTKTAAVRSFHIHIGDQEVLSSMDRQQRERIRALGDRLALALADPTEAVIVDQPTKSVPDHRGGEPTTP